jgi:ATP-dependent RNA helicase DeaD
MESVSRFQDLSLSPSLLAALDRVDYVTPTPIQAAFIPEALAGRDVMGQAQTGTGKTAAFLLPILQGLREEEPVPQALVLAPTRELVMQITAEAKNWLRAATFARSPSMAGNAFALSSSPCGRGVSS